METANKLWGNKTVQIDHHEMGLQYGNVPHHQIYYQGTTNRDHTNQETSIPQQQAQNAAQQKKITKTQAIQVNETDEGEGQINRVTSKRPVNQGSMEEGCLQKEPFFINHYYSHLVGQCCCQQHAMLVKEGQITLQSSTTLNHEKSKNSQKPQKLSEIKVCNNIMYPPTYDRMNEEGKRMLQDETRNPVVEPRIHLTQASVPS